ncbi:MAG: mechanosensitive ion channel [Candidatus Aenigmarchaeota archaeon]|nr:mechanosensitive ion channel [Candidatus Aenigmarchaeota archaeon]
MAMDLNAFLESLNTWVISFFRQLVPEYILPNLQLIIQIVIILLVGYIVGKISKIIVTKILSVAGLKRITAKTWTEDVLKVTGYKGNVVDLIGDLVKWSIYIVTLAVVVQVLGFASVANIFNQILIFVPRFIVAILVVVVGFIIADFFGKVFEEAIIKIFREDILSKFSGGVIKYSIAMIALIIALSMIGLDVNALLILFSALLLIVVMVTGLGLKDLIPNFTAGIHVKGMLKVGDRVKFRKYSGIVERMNPYSVDIRINKRTVTIPNSVLIKEPIEKEVRK